MLTVLNQNDDLEKTIFQSLIIEASKSSKPTYICDIRTDPSKFEQLCEEGRQRTAVNKKIQANFKPGNQITKGQKLTADEVGRLTEHPIEEMLGLDVAAVLEDSTDDRPDKVVDGVKFDVKGSVYRKTNSFSLPVWQVKTKGYDALLLVQHIEPGHSRVWCCKCEPGEAWKCHAGVGGKSAFFCITCELP